MAVRYIAAGGNNNYDNKLSCIRNRTVGDCFKIPLEISTGESEIKGKKSDMKAVLGSVPPGFEK
jgi:hypothetical protein